MGKGKAKQGGEAAGKPDAELITVYDERGRELKVSRAVWEKDVLLPNLQKAWGDPDQLYGQIAQGLRDGFAASVREAAEHLIEIDQSSERALVVCAVIYMDLADLERAEERLRSSFEKHGETGFALTNLAKVQDLRGQQEASRRTLRKALEIEPNQDNALLWWAAIGRESGAEQGYLAALQEISVVPGAWRPQLWIARERLRHGDREAALALYEAVLSCAAHEPGVLMMVSGDLGNAGALADLVRLVAPHYEPERDAPQAGLNVTQALKQLGRVSEAREMVRRLQALRLAPFAEHLARIESELADQALPQTPQQAPAIMAMPFQGPLWTRGLYDPSWLLPERAPDAPHFTFPLFANEAVAGSSTQSQKVDEAGRLTRALPLYLCEALGLKYRIKTGCLVFVAQGYGPAVFGHAMSAEEIAQFVPPNVGPQIAVLGALTRDGVRVEAWSMKERQLIASIRVPKDSELGTMAINLERELVAALRQTQLLAPDATPNFYRAPPASLQSGYISAIEQLLYQVLVANEVAPADSLWNERGMFETYVQLVDGWPDAPPNARLIGLSAVCAAALYKSAQLDPYRNIALRWLSEALPGSPLDRIAPAVLKRLGETDRLALWLARQTAPAGAKYAEWLQRVQAS